MRVGGGEGEAAGGGIVTLEARFDGLQLGDGRGARPDSVVQLGVERRRFGAQGDGEAGVQGGGGWREGNARGLRDFGRRKCLAVGDELLQMDVVLRDRFGLVPAVRVMGDDQPVQLFHLNGLCVVAVEQAVQIEADLRTVPRDGAGVGLPVGELRLWLEVGLRGGCVVAKLVGEAVALVRDVADARHQPREAAQAEDVAREHDVNFGLFDAEARNDGAAFADEWRGGQGKPPLPKATPPLSISCGDLNTFAADFQCLRILRKSQVQRGFNSKADERGEKGKKCGELHNA